MNLIEEFKSKWKPNKGNALTHMKLTVSHYKKCDFLVFAKQVEIAHKNLIKVGLTKEEADDTLKVSLKGEEYLWDGYTLLKKELT